MGSALRENLLLKLAPNLTPSAFDTGPLKTSFKEPKTPTSSKNDSGRKNSFGFSKQTSSQGNLHKLHVPISSKQNPVNFLKKSQKSFSKMIPLQDFNLKDPSKRKE